MHYSKNSEIFIIHWHVPPPKWKSILDKLKSKKYKLYIGGEVARWACMGHRGYWKTKARCSPEQDWDGSDYKEQGKKQPVSNHKKSYDAAKSKSK